MTQAAPAPVKPEVLATIQTILAELGEPQTPAQEKALTLFQSGEIEELRLVAASSLSDNYCKALGYLGGATKPNPAVAVVLAEAARAAAEVRKDRTLDKLSAAIATTFGVSI